jgi:two-component system OmpR family response regulator/two-component system KDP operon response regulator KdpE
VKKRIAIVDDEELVRGVYRRFFELEGYQVHLAASGREALSVLSQHSPEALLCDVEMPGMNGFELLDHLRQAGAMPPVVVLISGHTSEERQAEALARGAAILLAKPIDPDQLVATVEALCSASGRTPPR